MQITTREKVLLLGSLANMLRQGEALADAPEIVLPIARNGVDQTQLHWQMRGTSEQNTIAIQELSAKRSGDLLYLTWQIGKDFYAVPGLLHLTLVGKDGAGNVTVKYIGDTPLMVSPVEEGQYDPPAGILEHCMDQVEAAKGYAQNAAASAQKAEAEGQKKVAEAAAQADRAEAAADRAECKIDDTKATTHTAYSSLFADDRYCPPIHAGPAPIVQMHDVLGGYPMQVVTHIEPVQEGSGEPSLENVRPILGVTKLTAVRCGKNLFNAAGVTGFSAGGGTVNGDGSFTISKTFAASRTNFVGWGLPPTKGTVVTIDFDCVSEQDNLQINVSLFCNAHYTDIKKGKNHVTITETVTIPENLAIQPGPPGSKSIRVSNICLTVGSASQQYEPYRGNNYTVQFGQTVYSAMYQWDTGKLTFLGKFYNLKVSDMNNSEDYPGWFFKKGNIFDVVGSANTHFNVLCNVGKKVNINTIATSGDAIFMSFSEYHLTQTQWKTQYPDFMVQILLPYKIPLTIHLTPQEILSLQGTNTLYSDTGKTAVFARKDPIAANQSLERRIAELELKLSQI